MNTLNKRNIENTKLNKESLMTFIDEIIEDCNKINSWNDLN